MLKVIFFTFLIPVLVIGQQNDQHVWKVVDGNGGSKFWYDLSSVDTTTGNTLNVWILERNQPPKQYEGIEGDVFRSKTLYTINLITVKYGILKVRYYDLNNKEIFSFDYDNPMPPESIRFPYPITNNSLLFYLLKDLYGPETNQVEKMN